MHIESIDNQLTINKNQKSHREIEDFLRYIKGCDINRQAELVGIVNLDDFKKLPALGRPLLFEGETVNKFQNINEKQLVVVKAFNHDFDETEGCIKSYFGAKLGSRESIHFTLNHYVKSHAYGSWETAKKVAIVPFDQMIEKNGPPRTINSADTYWRAESLKLPETTVILTKDTVEENDNTQPKNYHKIKYSGEWPINIVTDIVLKKLGYSNIKGCVNGDESGLSSMLGELVKKYNTKTDSHQGDMVSFQLDDINMILLVAKDGNIIEDSEYKNENRIKFIDGLSNIYDDFHLLSAKKQQAVIGAINKIILETPKNLAKPENENDLKWFIEFCFFEKLNTRLLELDKLIKKDRNELNKTNQYTNLRDGDLMNNIIQIVKSIDKELLERYIEKFLPLKEGRPYDYAQAMGSVNFNIFLKHKNNFMNWDGDLHDNKKWVEDKQKIMSKLIDYCKNN